MKKKWILIAMTAFAVVAAAVAAILLFPKTPDYTFPPFTSQYEDKKNYESQDANIVFDGILDEEIWQNRRWLEVDHVSEEYIGVKMTTYFGEDGLYMAFDVDDYGVYYDKYRYVDYNSGLQIYLAPLSGGKSITGCGYQISLSAGEFVDLKQFGGSRFEEYLGRVYMESRIKGEMNSPKATGYTIEAYIDYALLGENCKEVYAYPAIIHTTSATESERQWYSFGLNEKGVSWTRADTWWSFDAQGLVGHQITFEAGENGTVEGADFVPGGDDYTFTLAPNAGCYAEAVTVNGQDVTSRLYYYQGKTLCTMECVKENLDIQVTYAPIPNEKTEITGTVKDTNGNALNAQVWAVAGGYSQMLTADTQGNFSGSVPALEGLELFASAEGYVSEELAVQAGENAITLAKMYFGNNENVVRSSTNMALWDLSRMYQNRVRMISTEYSMQLVHSEIYSGNVYTSANLVMDVEQGADTRAGFTFYVDEGLSVFVALTVHGEVNEWNPNGELGCSLQVIAEQNGERIWNNGGIIVPIENPEKIMTLAATEGVPIAVHYNKGGFDVWVDGQQVGYGVYPKDENGKNRLQTNASVAVGLETWSSRAVYENLTLDGSYSVIRKPSAPGWNLTKLGSGVAVCKTGNGGTAMLREEYYSKLSISAKLPLELRSGKDLRAGFVLANSQGTEVFVALTANGQHSGGLHYSLQIISGGWASWAVSGSIEDISAWGELQELAKNGGIPMTVYAENGKLTVGLNGYVIAEKVVPLDAKGKPVFAGNTALKPGLSADSTSLTFTGVSVGTNKPVLKNPVERLWDISKAEEGTYTSLTDEAWACLWLGEDYTDKAAVSANLSLKLQEGDDIRAGVVLRNEQGVEVFVALTAHGLSHYSVQVISGGWASWAIEGQIADISTWRELTSMDSIPLTVYIENGKLTLGINGYVIADGIVPLDAAGNPTFGSSANVKIGLATAGTALTFTQAAAGTEKPVLSQKLSAEKGGTIVIPGDCTDANYAVLELTVKALDAITYDWNSNIIVSPSGAIWDAYDFQMVYGTSQNQNLVKLTGPGASVDGFTIPQEQWVNDAAFEKPYTEEGMSVKLVRMDTWAYLLADMGSGYTIVGRMYLPAAEATSFSVWTNNTAIEVTDYTVTVSEDAAIAALNGLTLTLDSNGMVFPVSGESWTLEGRLVIDTATFPWGTDEYRMYAGADSWTQATSVYYNKANWYLQNHINWANTQLPDEQWWMLSAESGGMWVRFEKSADVLTVSVSADGENWTSSLSYTGVTAKGIYLLATQISQLRDIKLTAGA